MKILFLSDTHGMHKGVERYFKPFSKADMVIHGGDICGRSTVHDVSEFLDWFSKLDYQYKIFIAGNHDRTFETDPRLAKSLIPEGIIYLQDSMVEIEGLKFWGSPVQPTFLHWAFNRNRGSEIKWHWDQIPDDTDILITHGPPFEILDITTPNVMSWENVGCVDLKEAIFNRVKPKMHLFGHLHDGFGHETHDGIEFYNGSVLNGQYRIVNRPHLIEI